MTVLAIALIGCGGASGERSAPEISDNCIIFRATGNKLCGDDAVTYCESFEEDLTADEQEVCADVLDEPVLDTRATATPQPRDPVPPAGIDRQVNESLDQNAGYFRGGARVHHGELRVPVDPATPEDARRAICTSLDYHVARDQSWITTLTYGTAEHRCS